MQAGHFVVDFIFYKTGICFAIKRQMQRGIGPQERKSTKEDKMKEVKSLQARKSELQAEIAAIDEKIACSMYGTKIGTIFVRIGYDKNEYRKITGISMDGDAVKVITRFHYNSDTNETDRPEYYSWEFTWNPAEWAVVDECLVESLIKRYEFNHQVKEKNITSEIWCLLPHGGELARRPWTFDRFKEEFALTISLLCGHQGEPVSIRLQL